MATKKKTAAKKKAPSGKKTKRDAPPTLKKDKGEDLRSYLSGDEKTGRIKVLDLADEHVLGRVRGRISSGSLAIDRLLDGGFARGRIVEVYGKEQTGKTTTAQGLAAQTQKLGGTVLLYDIENKWDHVYAEAMGVNPKDVVVVEPENDRTIQGGVHALNRALDFWFEKKGWDHPLTLIWDSIGGSSTREELLNLDDQQPGVAGRALRKAMRVLSSKIAQTGTVAFFVNQTYAIIGGGGFGPRSTTYGGGGIRYHATHRIEMIRMGQHKLPSGHIIGIEGKAKLIKNSLGAEGEIDYAIAYLRGFDDTWTIFETLKAAHVIQQAGAYWKLTGMGEALDALRWQGQWAGLDELLRKQPELRAPLVAKWQEIR